MNTDSGRRLYDLTQIKDTTGPIISLREDNSHPDTRSDAYDTTGRIIDARDTSPRPETHGDVVETTLPTKGLKGPTRSKTETGSEASSDTSIPTTHENVNASTKKTDAPGVRRAYTQKLSPSKERQIGWLDAFAKKRGVEIVIQDTIRTDRGDANGVFDKSTGRVTISLDATDQAYMFVGMHELTHYIEEYNPDAFELLTDTVRIALEDNGRNFDDLVKYQMERFGLNEKDAEGEVIANTVPAVLSNDAYVRGILEADKTLFQKISDFIHKLLDDLHGIFGNLSKQQSWQQMAALQKDVDGLEAIAQVFDTALGDTAIKRNENADSENETANSENDHRYSLNPSFAAEYDAWDKKSRTGHFVLGSPTQILLDIGVPDKEIIMTKNDILKKMAKHGLSESVFKQLPKMLDDPRLVLRSITQADSYVLYGELYDDQARPVMAALKINATADGLVVADVNRVMSVYARQKDGSASADQSLINRSEILYPTSYNKKTADWARSLGLQLPSGVLSNGSNDSVPKANTIVNPSIRENGENDTRRFSLKDADPRRDEYRKEQLEAAKKAAKKP